ncbi:MAG: DUF1772 domain-containing protein [Parvibaculaceae bacterium]
MTLLTSGLIVASILGSGLMAGLFFVFSNTVMAALGRLPAAHGMAAMQSINAVILNPVFLLAFMGTAILSALVIVLVALRWEGMGSGLVIAGAAAYLAGGLLVTMLFNVPLNKELAAAAAADPASADLWMRYLTTWTLWNHVRTFSCIAALLLQTIGLACMASRLPA